MWDKVIEKAVNIKIRTSLQLSSEIRKINSKCPKYYKPSPKKDKNNTNREYQDRDKDKDKAKSHNPSFANS